MEFDTVMTFFYHKIKRRKIKLLRKFRIQTYKISLDSDGNLDLIESLNKVRKLGFSRIFLESGIKLTTSFLKNGLVDELKIFISNKKLAKNGTDTTDIYTCEYCDKKFKRSGGITIMASDDGKSSSP